MATYWYWSWWLESCVAGDPKREGYGNNTERFPSEMGYQLQVTRKEKGMATKRASIISLDGTKLQVTRKEKGMATRTCDLSRTALSVAGDPKREGYGNTVVSPNLDTVKKLQVTRKEKGMATAISV